MWFIVVLLESDWIDITVHRHGRKSQRNSNTSHCLWVTACTVLYIFMCLITDSLWLLNTMATKSWWCRWMEVTWPFRNPQERMDSMTEPRLQSDGTSVKQSCVFMFSFQFHIWTSVPHPSELSVFSEKVLERSSDHIKLFNKQSLIQFRSGPDVERLTGGQETSVQIRTFFPMNTIMSADPSWRRCWCAATILVTKL